MIIHDFDVIRMLTAPDKAKPPLIIDSNAVLAGAIFLQSFE